MEVSEVRRMKEELEANISLSLSVLLSDFQDITGVQVIDVTVGMVETVCVDGTGKSLVSGVNVFLEI